MAYMKLKIPKNLIKKVIITFLLKQINKNATFIFLIMFCNNQPSKRIYSFSL